MHLYLSSFLISIIFWLWIIRKYDRFEREPLQTVLFVFIAGGLISIVPAGIFNLLFGDFINVQIDPAYPVDSGMGKLLILHGFVGLNEEFWKAAATVFLIRKMKSFNEPADALVYAMTVAFGFSVFENIEYSLKFGFYTFFVRQFNAVPLHIGLAAIWGIGIAKAKFSSQDNYLVTLAPYVLLAAFIHAIYNLSVTQIISPVLSLLLPSVIAILLIRFAIRKIKRYAEEGPFSKMLICQNCHNPNSPDARLCQKCGKELYGEKLKVNPFITGGDDSK